MYFTIITIYISLFRIYCNNIDNIDNNYILYRNKNKIDITII